MPDIIPVTQALVTASGREVTAEEAIDIKAMLFEAVGHYIDAHRFKLLMEPPPAYAVKRREGGKGAMYPYLKHGYVKLKLTQIFGIDWSHELLPFFAGEPYRLTSADDSRMTTGNATVTVYGKLTINIHGRRSVVSIVRTGFGSSEWRDKQELGDVLKGAQSDAFKVAAATLGPALGLTLYWDDELELSNTEAASKQQRDLERAWALQQEAQRTKSPTTVGEFLARAKQDYKLNLNDVTVKMGTTMAALTSTITSDPIAAWAKLKAAMTVTVENVATSQQPQASTPDTANNSSAVESSPTPANNTQAVSNVTTTQNNSDES